MAKIKFGTDGWRAVIGDQYTVENVARVSVGAADWMKKNFENPKLVIGHDCRFNGDLFVETAVKIFLSHGIEVVMSEGFISTPMLSYAAQKHNASLGVIVTASHNPPSYNGYKLKGGYGGPLLPDQVQEVEDLIPDAVDFDYQSQDLESAKKLGKLSVGEFEQEYITHMKNSFDIEAIKKSGLKLVFDAMYGSGQRVVKQILPDVESLHCDYNPSFMGQAPEPILKNLGEMSEFIKSKGNIDCGLATDGDADRIGLMNGKGEFVDSHHVILLLLNYLVNHKKLTGKVVTAFSCTPRIEKFCKMHGLEHQTVKIGFKHIAGIILEEDVLLGGEESGGIATKDHIPERDGIWMGMIIWEYMAKSGKSLDELIAEVYKLVGEFKFERNDLHIDEDLKQTIIENCKADKYKSFGKYEVKEVGTIDGFKYFFDEERWLMIRPSGTEPVLRTYAEAPTLKEVREILDICEKTLKA